MLDKNIKKTLFFLLKELKCNKYVLVGSLNLYVQGIKTSPRDIDLLTTVDELKKIDQILKKYSSKSIFYDKKDGRNSYRAFYDINNVEVEILGNVNNMSRPKNFLNRTIIIKKYAKSIPCAKLMDELIFYKKIKRTDKIDLLKKHLMIK